MNRIKIETLVTIQVHQRDVFADLTKLFKERKLSDANDFEWLKQCRFTWMNHASDRHGPGACIIAICDVEGNDSALWESRIERLGLARFVIPSAIFVRDGGVGEIKAMDGALVHFRGQGSNLFVEMSDDASGGATDNDAAHNPTLNFVGKRTPERIDDPLILCYLLQPIL